MAHATVVWFRQDLRLADNPALCAAIRRGGPVVPVYLWSPEEDRRWAMGAAARVALHATLQALDQDLRRRGSRLLLCRGPVEAALRALVRETQAGAVFWNRLYEPAPRERDAHLAAALRAQGIEVQSFNAALLFEPETIQTRAGGPFKVFTPYWKACLASCEPPEPLDAPAHIPALATWPTSLELAALRLEPRVDWASGIRAAWAWGESAAGEQLQAFIHGVLARYDQGRDLPAEPGTSRLSPYLHFGTLSPRQVWHAVRGAAAFAPGLETAAEGYLRQLGWREFAHHLLWHFPATTDAPLRPEFERFPWRDDPVALEAWQRGRTGYPYIDAGLRELWTTGWMHNRVRMAVASFLVKDLLLPWHEGARWFWDTLVDADLANNTLGWQWTAGCGADAAPYFRVFNPVLQGEKFDPQGAYVRRWIPELETLPSRYIHCPWTAPAALRKAVEYPEPMVDHDQARLRALEALGALKSS